MGETEREAAAASSTERMQAAFDAIAARDLDALARLWHDDVVEDFVVVGERRGRTAARAFFAELFAAVPDLEFRTVRILEAGAGVAVGEWRLRGTFTGGPFQGIQPTGRTVELRGVDLMEFVDGLLRRNTVYYDGLAFARQVGLLPAAGSRGDRALVTAFNAVTEARRRARGALRGRAGRA